LQLHAARRDDPELAAALLRPLRVDPVAPMLAGAIKKWRPACAHIVEAALKFRVTEKIRCADVFSRDLIDL
jgi:hypothetical protein